jgi:hypothetical protein
MGVAQSHPAYGSTLSSTFFSLKILKSDGTAQQALVAAEAADNYRGRCAADPLNASAREGQVYAAARLGGDEHIRLTDQLHSLTPYLSNELQQLGTVDVVYLMPSADGGMPHTRPHAIPSSVDGIICLPLRASPLTLETLSHELWHIHQRRHRDKWHRFLQEKWNFVPYKGALPDKLRNALRLNPDTLEAPLWVWRDEWVPVCIFTHPRSPTFQDTAVWYYNTKRGYYVTTAPAAYLEMFGRSLPAAAYEHPYELGAYMLSLQYEPRGDAFQALKGEFGFVKE